MYVFTRNCSFEATHQVSSVELMFGTWGAHPIPRDTIEIIPWMKANQPLQKWPEWFLQSIEIMLEADVPLQIITGKYRTFALIRLLLIDSYSIASLSWVHYEKFKYLPDNFAAIGDSTMIVNPVYGSVFHLYRYLTLLSYCPVVKAMLRLSSELSHWISCCAPHIARRPSCPIRLARHS